MNGRACFDRASSTIYLARDSDEFTAVHEMMHVMDSLSQDFFDDSKAYFVRRTAGRPRRLLKEMVPDGGYEDWEYTYDVGRRCIDPYAYKEYRDQDTGGLVDFEVAPVGVQYLYADPRSLMRDPELLAFAVHKIWRV